MTAGPDLFDVESVLIIIANKHGSNNNMCCGSESIRISGCMELRYRMKTEGRYYMEELETVGKDSQNCMRR